MRVSNDENAVFVSGTLGGAPELSHSLYGEDFYSAELLVPRLSGTMDHVPLTIPGRNLAFMPDEGDRLSVWGQLRTYNRHTEQGTHLCVTVFAKGIEPLGEEEMPQNEVSLSGYLCKPAVFRTTPFLREIGDMLIACNRSFNKSDYLPCIAWGRNRWAAGCTFRAGYRAGGTRSSSVTAQYRTGRPMRYPAHPLNCFKPFKIYRR